MAKCKDLTGIRYGRLTVVKRVENSRSGSSQWLCRCDCGEERIHTAGTLNYGVVLSCGCLGKESRLRSNTIHGGSKTKLYRVWHSMKDRCTLESVSAFKHYGGRGISVCDEWKDYQVFHDWAMASGYKEGLSLDRIDVNGNYEPSNCRWASKCVQANNTRSNRLICYNGVSHTMSEWSKILGIGYSTLAKRFQDGWSIEKAFTTPIRGGGTNDN